MNLIEKLEPAILIFAIIIGLILSDIKILSNNIGNLINLFLCIMLYGIFLEVPLKNLKKSFKNIKFSSTSIIINFIWTPIFGYFLGNLFLNGNMDIFIGFFMLILTPCTDWYLIFTKIAKGDLNLSLSILPINLILQIVLLPIYLIIFFSSNDTVNYSNLVYSLIIVIVIPFLSAQITKLILNNKLKEITNFFSKYQIVFLALAVFAIFNSQGNQLFGHVNSVLTIFIPLIIFFITTTLIDLLLSEQIHLTYEEYASLTMTTLARNSPLALAIAINSFPNHELIIIALVIGPLIELPILYLFFTCRLKI